METHYTDVCNLADLLFKLTNSYRLLIGGANELNGMALASKSDIKDALKRVDAVGDLIDDVIDTLDECECSYLNYCKIRSHFIQSKTNAKYIQTEIENEIFPEDKLDILKDLKLNEVPKKE